MCIRCDMCDYLMEAVRLAVFSINDTSTGSEEGDLELRGDYANEASVSIKAIFGVKHIDEISEKMHDMTQVELLRSVRATFWAMATMLDKHEADAAKVVSEAPSPAKEDKPKERRFIAKAGWGDHKDPYGYYIVVGDSYCNIVYRGGKVEKSGLVQSLLMGLLARKTVKDGRWVEIPADEANPFRWIDDNVRPANKDVRDAVKGPLQNGDKVRVNDQYEDPDIVGKVGTVVNRDEENEDEDMVDVELEDGVLGFVRSQLDRV